jgi:hypothetical protein
MINNIYNIYIFTSKMVYIGYPVTLRESLRICNITVSSDESDYWSFHNESTIKIKNYLRNYHLDFYELDKGVYVIGFEINDLPNMSVSIDEFMLEILKLKHKVKNYVLEANIDLSEVKINLDIEGESIIEINPEPYFINYGY